MLRRCETLTEKLIVNAVVLRQRSFSLVRSLFDIKDADNRYVY